VVDGVGDVDAPVPVRVPRTKVVPPWISIVPRPSPRRPACPDCSRARSWRRRLLGIRREHILEPHLRARGSGCAHVDHELPDLQSRPRRDDLHGVEGRDGQDHAPAQVGSSIVDLAARELRPCGEGSRQVEALQLQDCCVGLQRERVAVERLVIVQEERGSLRPPVTGPGSGPR